jgi:hypothetical protein
MMVLHDFLLKHITPLQEHAHPTWMYTEVNDTTWLECGNRSDWEADKLALMLAKLSHDRSFADFVTPPAPCRPICMDQAARMMLLRVMPSLDDVDITPM